MEPKHLSEPWFSLIGLGAKSVEGRLNKGSFAKLTPGDILTFFNDDFGFRRVFRTKIIRTRIYQTFHAYLKAEGIHKCLPAYGVDTLKDGVHIYRNYYNVADERQYGILAIHLKVL